MLPIESVLNAAARLIAGLLKFSHISTIMINQLHWLPLSARLELKILVVVLKSKLQVLLQNILWITFTPLYLHRSLRSSDWHVLFVLRVRTAVAQTRSFATIGP